MKQRFALSLTALIVCAMFVARVDVNPPAPSLQFSRSVYVYSDEPIQTLSASFDDAPKPGNWIVALLIVDGIASPVPEVRCGVPVTLAATKGLGGTAYRGQVFVSARRAPITACTVTSKSIPPTLMTAHFIDVPMRSAEVIQ